MSGKTPGDIQSTRIRDTLNRVVKSETFGNADRLQQILNYVVEQHLSGRADTIKAKSIALDVYQYTADEVGDRENSIRVDAGRLRRRLQVYYSNEGKDDPVVISLPTGSYAPKFRFREHSRDDDTAPKPSETVGKTHPATASRQFGSSPNVLRTGVLLLVAVAVAAMTSVWMFATDENRSDNRPPDTRNNAAQVAIFEASPARVKATNLADAGRDLIFPAVDPVRLQAALMVFEASRAADETYFGGYAGAAQIHALSALISLDKDRSIEAVKLAKTNLEKAETLAPDAAWTHSARAAYEWAVGNTDGAISESSIALSLDQNDPHLVEFDSLISLFSGNFERVIETVTPLMERTDLAKGAVFDNALGAAYFHIGNPERSIEVFENAVASGAPSGPISVAYLAASHQKSGEATRARRWATQLKATWPEFPLDRLFEKLFLNSDDSSLLIETVRAAGWAPKDGGS